MLEVYVKTNYVDFEDFDNPIKSYLKRVIRQEVMLNESIIKIANFQKNVLTDHSDYLF